MKDELVKFFQDLYKPKSQFGQEKVEYNQINILSEYQLYNIIFAKNELMFDAFMACTTLIDLFLPSLPNHLNPFPSSFTPFLHFLKLQVDL
jgi:hypothetical protein